MNGKAHGRPCKEVEDDFSAVALCNRATPGKKKTASKESVHRRSTSDFLMEAYLHVENT